MEQAVTGGRVQWNLDTAHSSVDLSVRHMGLFTVRASLGEVKGTAETADGKLTQFEATINPATINTGNGDRDAHLRSGDFLNVEQFPEIRFRSTRVQPAGPRTYTVTGDLTIRGQTHAVQFDVETVDPIKDPFGFVRAGATASGEISRKQWGLEWNQVLETGSLLVGDEVKFTLDVQAVAAS